PAFVDRARVARRSRGAPARRGDELARRRERALCADGARAPDARADHARRRAPPRDGEERRPHRGHGPGTRHRLGLARRAGARAGPVRAPRFAAVPRRPGGGAMRIAAALSLFLAALPAHADTLRIGSKRFTESYILGEVLKQAAAGKATVEHRP